LFNLTVVTAKAGELGQAASRGDLATVDLLLQNGSEALDERDALGTPLHRAIMGQHYRVARRLIAAGANLDIADEYLGTPRYLAVR
jgi:ankyrin repeat protein